MTTRRNLWLTKRARPAEAPRETMRGLVEVTVGGAVRPVYVIRWDSAQGPVLYFVPLGGVPAAEWDRLVWQLCEQVLEREQWNRAVLIDPVPIVLTAGDGDGPRVRLHRVRFSAGREDGGPRLKRGDDHPVTQVAWVLRAVLPIWIAGTETVATARAALVNPGSTLSVADPTAWPGQEASLRVAVQARFPQLYPLGWAILAAEGAALLHDIVAGHARTPDRGEGWHLVARPQVPRPPERLLPLLPLLAEAVTPVELGEPAVAEIAALRAAAIAGDPRGVLYRRVAEKLASLTVQVQMAQLARNAPQPSFQSPWVAETVTATATWAGPVVDTWRQTLTPVADLPAVVRLKRVADLLRFTRPGEVREAHLDWAGRLVLVLNDQDGPDPTPWMCAEWPCDEKVVADWTGDTILAADRPGPGRAAGPLLAITPEARIDQFPLSSRAASLVRFELGDATRDSRMLFRILLRLALEPAAAAQADRNFFFDTIVEDPGMTLWPAVMGAGASVRLRWDTAQAFAAADFARAQRLLAPDAPKIYRYYAIALRQDAPLEETTQVVRTSAGPGGFATEEHLKFSGGWTRSFILDDIGRCKGNDEYRRIRPDEVREHIAVVYPKWADV